MLCSKESLIINEQHYIDNHKPDYNICKTAGNTLGRTMSEDGKRRVSEARKGWKMSEEHKLKLIAANTGLKRSDAFKQNLSLNKKGKKLPGTSKYRSEVNKRPILQFDLDNNFIREWDSIKACYEFFQGKEYYLRESLKNYDRPFYNYKFKYK